ncbi:Mrr restriction system protein [Lactobacillus selangorensis]|uniref:Mrr restriction system protein n=1 Tax=Lactobacillus selangorensis TaxID=81857 RepID=A0A0R2FVI7_9LACO|nr:restriction endonuclease [Lactobacillus selangorensis]KRN29276.1 Mrr restriction system protein [Lactobacillus selangorensis]KRN34195.1 Mrr restriction system protein [Lactobacillus selangorensis]
MDYKTLKLSKDGMPTWDAMLPIVLKTAAGQKEWTRKEIETASADALGLPEDLRQKKYKNSLGNVIENRVDFALSDLSIVGAISRVRRGVYQITDVGKKLLETPDNINVDYLHSLPKYQEHQAELNTRNQRQDIAEDAGDEKEADDDVAEQIFEKVSAYNNKVGSELLDRIQSGSPTFFENLVVQLLISMGYQGPNGTAQVTQATNDGGIDGIINQDPLGTRTIYLQAKRYKKDNVVQRPQIQQFAGAIHSHNGVFITTSSFSAGATEEAKKSAIVLIDGIRLTELMLKYHVGIQTKRKYELVEIDEDFFEE